MKVPSAHTTLEKKKRRLGGEKVSGEKARGGKVRREKQEQRKRRGKKECLRAEKRKGQTDG
jgi:hypothetical protein